MQAGNKLILFNEFSWETQFYKEFPLPLTEQAEAEIYANLADPNEARDLIARVESFDDLGIMGEIPHTFKVKQNNEWR